MPAESASTPLAPAAPAPAPAPAAPAFPYRPGHPPPGLPGPGGGAAPPWVLMYHSVADPVEDPYRITVSPARLDAQLTWLRGRGLRGVSVGDLLTARSAGRGGGLVGLTFDDGYADFVDNALPLLRRHECTATLFVLPGRLGGDNGWDPLGPRKPLLTAAGIRTAARPGWRSARTACGI